ncbi:hypothetical protein [Alkalicoccus daliensis]|uniref:Family 2 glycosyl transferase n=1 Tax=Alkalicoccus daliensis TaxID=745820 RepID=A0A1H0KNA7_9BACI|nr:hypothetical protein [Alkalicoccus daliensis]SDO57293.1 hypothetical protein SAMN04488053_1194 [Alkalicoccus daliensis]
MKIISGIIILIIAGTAPLLFWLFQEERELTVSVIDKTVPTESYREHQSVHWLLNHHKYTAEGSYDASSDYYGFHPDESSETYEIKELPASYEDTDLIYVTDTYGVYEEDLPWTEETSDGPPELIYGGWTEEEWQAVNRAVETTTTDLVMEFNTFASPTSEAVRTEILDRLQLTWEGWTGRHFEDLSPEAEEVAPWLISRYEEANGEWNFDGPGYALVNDLTEEIAVLPVNEEYFTEDNISLAFTENGQEMFNLEDSPSYPYWFDIVTPESEEQILASYEWHLTEAGADVLDEYNIPASFPAVLHHEVTGSQIYYFAGDFVDIEDAPGFYQYGGYAALKSLITPESIYPESSFFWNTVSPMLKVIFAEASSDENEAWQMPMEITQASSADISYSSRVAEDHFEVYQDGEWVELPIKGVNMGMAKPGYAPGEAAITRAEYRRWFEQIGEMNANTIRNYTLHPPAFYEELLSYNLEAEEPLYLFHGVWIDEEPLEKTRDAFTPEIIEKFEKEMLTVADVIHGNAQVEQVPGHAYGNYQADISPYVIGWIIGIEWYPVMVDNMLTEYPDLGDYDGKYIYTEDADPMEYWLAERLDTLFTYEKEEYASMRPLSFTNWVTTDNLDHPAEPSEQEDMAVVDPNHIHTKEDAEAVGMFASYHVYPYYPDFLNLEEEYLEYEDHRGNPNSYAGYLNDLEESHELPILVAEFGIPASRGRTHSNPYGWDQGFISEQQQGEIVSYLYEVIEAEGMLGGLVFTWQDEWFKRTWNTMDYDDPYRRPYWSNAQTNEQQFGLLSFDLHKVRINGEDDWAEGTVLAENSSGDLKELTVDHDERYLYVKYTGEFSAEDEVVTHFSIRPGEGVNVGGFGADFRLTLAEDSGEMEIAGDYDTFYFDYEDSLPEDERTSPEDLEETFHPIRLALNKEITRPDTGEVLPFEYDRTGIFQEGIADPSHEDYNSLNDYVFNAENDIIEVRIPWMLFNAKDPSLKGFIGEMEEDWSESFMKIDQIEMQVSLMRNGETLEELFPADGYTWEDWDIPEHTERLKESYYILQEAFEE